MTTNAPDTGDRGEIIIYQAPDGAAALDVQIKKETVWLSQRQMSLLFEKDTDTIGLHIRNIYREGELEEAVTTEESSVVQDEGGRQVRRSVRFYNLDVVISVGYRVKSLRGTQFRIWATGVLREHLTRGHHMPKSNKPANGRKFSEGPRGGRGAGGIEGAGRWEQTLKFIGARCPSVSPLR